MGYYAIIVLDIFLIRWNFLSANMRAVVILQLSCLIILGQLREFDLKPGGATEAKVRQLVTGTILTFALSIGLYHLII